jgi:hypothetical protein
VAKNVFPIASRSSLLDIVSQRTTVKSFGHTRASLPLLLSAERVLGGVHDRHFMILSTVTLQVTHVLLHQPNLNHRIAALAIVVTAQPIRDEPCATANLAKQELSARNLRNIYRHLRLRCR